MRGSREEEGSGWRSASAADAQIQQYLTLADKTLKPMIEGKRSELDALKTMLEEYKDLQRQLLSMADHKAAQTGGAAGSSGKPYKMLADIGEGFRMHARVDDVDSVFLHIGCGVYPQLKVSEALLYVDKKIEILQR